MQNKRSHNREIAQETLEIMERGFYTSPTGKAVNIDAAQTGLGGTNSWGQQPLSKYRLKPEGTYQYSFRIIPGTKK